MKINKGKTILATIANPIALLLCCTGCVTAPFVDDTLAEFDALPMSALFTERKIPAKISGTLGHGDLIGRWITNPHVEVYERETTFGQYSMKPSFKTMTVEYDFAPDGTFTETKNTYSAYKIDNGFTSTVQKNRIEEIRRGKWSCDQGTLSLNALSMELAWYMNDVKQDHGSTKESYPPGAMVEKKKVVMREHGMFSLEAQKSDAQEEAEPYVNALYKDQGSNIRHRTTSAYTPEGILIERRILVEGVKDGRERGHVTETASSPEIYSRLKE